VVKDLEFHQGWPRSLSLHFRRGGSEWCTDCLGSCNMWERSQSEAAIKTATMVSQCV